MRTSWDCRLENSNASPSQLNSPSEQSKKHKQERRANNQSVFLLLRLLVAGVICLSCSVQSNPSILFLDEPTSSLDSRAALVVVRVIRKIAQRGRAVVCTIHQPSAQLLSEFDRMLLLQSGGTTVFFGQLGDHSDKLVEYFSTADIPKDKFRPEIGESENPASWMSVAPSLLCAADATHVLLF